MRHVNARGASSLQRCVGNLRQLAGIIVDYEQAILLVVGILDRKRSLLRGVVVNAPDRVILEGQFFVEFVALRV